MKIFVDAPHTRFNDLAAWLCAGEARESYLQVWDGKKINFKKQTWYNFANDEQAEHFCLVARIHPSLINEIPF